MFVEGINGRQMTQSENTKRIAKNTVVMYIRMFAMMLIGLYTSRVILNVLGISDYGIYNVVGGLVGMFSIVSSSLSSSISRFITFEIGKEDITRLKEILATSFIAQCGMSLLIVILIEYIGVWYLGNKMSLPGDRLDAAIFVLRCTVASFALSLIMTPYSATIFAHEKFGIYAYLTLFESFMKLLTVFLLAASPFDKLETYALLLLGVNVVVQLINFIYCRRNFVECHFKLKYNKKLLKEVGGFAGWSFWGNTSWILNSQGIDLLLNFFFGVTLNAARGIANQVNNIVQGFVANFMITLNPQITKSYAVGNIGYMHKLIYSGAKYSYFLMLFFSIPLCLETEQILVIWLKIIPEYAIPFVRLTLLSTMAFVLGNTLTTAQSATGVIKKSAIVTSLFTFMEFPLTFFLFKMDFSPICCYVIHLIIYMGLIFVKVYLVKNLISMTYKTYIYNVILKVSLVTITAASIPFLIYIVYPPSMLRMLQISIVSFASTTLCVYFWGMEKNERLYLIKIVKKRLT